MPIATLLMERRVEGGSILRVVARHGEVNVAVLESEAGRAQRREAEPLRLADGQKVSRDGLVALVSAAHANLMATNAGLDLEALKLEREELETRRRMADLWRDPRAAAQVLESCDRLDRVTERLVWLEREQEEISAVLAQSEKREEWSRLADRVRRHASAVEQARMELLLLGSAGLRDALVEIRPIGRARPARDLLYQTYVAWRRSGSTA